MRKENDFSVLALGGLGEIGMNCLIVETEGRLLIIDCGVMFPSDDLGIDVIHPGFEYLLTRRDDIEGVVLTHGHEDHVSGLPFLLREIDLPVFGGTYALAVLKSKMAESANGPRPNTYPLCTFTPLTLGPFTVTSFPMPHSIIENTGLRVDMAAGRLLHTGDFKLNMLSDGGRAALDTLRRAAGERVDLMLSDATGSEEDNVAGEERAVADTLDALFKGAAHRVFVAIFSSNIRRMDAVIRAAAANGRKIALCGRSVHNHFRTARTTGSLSVPAGSLVSVEEAASLPRREMAVIVSGTQGEHRSALNRLSQGGHNLLTVEAGDLVVLSSRFIPGNELAISAVIDRLLLRGAEVVHRGINPGVHVSGHGGRAEIAAAIRAVNPRCYLPVHGTYRHLKAAAVIAHREGIAQVGVALNGQSARVSSAGIQIDAQLAPVRRVFIDKGGRLCSSTLKERRILAANGVLAVSLRLGSTCRDTGEIEVQARGVVPSELIPWFSGIIRDKTRELIDAGEACLDDSNAAREHIRSGLRRFVLKQLSREPLVLVSILRI